tara:strand:- start:42 stop:296 length:255 start_codon:yes stop_codon:yes gene_type:complete
MNLNKQNLINKIIYRAQYRGTKEMDIFVGSFVKSIINSLSINDLEDLNILIKMNDEEIIKIIKREKNFKNNKILEDLINFNKKN